MRSWKLLLLLVAALSGWTGLMVFMSLNERGDEQRFARELALHEASWHGGTLSGGQACTRAPGPLTGLFRVAWNSSGDGISLS